MEKQLLGWHKREQKGSWETQRNIYFVFLYVLFFLMYIVMYVWMVINTSNAHHVLTGYVSRYTLCECMYIHTHTYMFKKNTVFISHLRKEKSWVTENNLKQLLQGQPAGMWFGSVLDPGTLALRSVCLNHSFLITPTHICTPPRLTDTF